MVVWWLCWHRTILMKNIRRKQYSQFPPVHASGKPRSGVAYVPCVTNLRAIYAQVIQWHVTGMLSLAEHWHGRRAVSNHFWADSVIAMWHVIFLQHLARACSEQFRSTAVLPINHVVQMPQCLPGFVNHDYCNQMIISRYGKNVKWDFISRYIYTVPSLAAVLSIKLAPRSSVHRGTLVRADRHPRPRENRHDRHPRHHAKL